MLKFMNTLIGSLLTLKICGLIAKDIWRAHFHLPGPQQLTCPGTIFLFYPLSQALIALYANKLFPPLVLKKTSDVLIVSAKTKTKHKTFQTPEKAMLSETVSTKFSWRCEWRN